MRNNVKKTLSSANSMLNDLSLFIHLFNSNGHIHNVISTFSNARKLDIKCEVIVSTLSNVFQINAERDNVDSAWLNFVNSKVDVIINLKTMLNQL